MKPLREFKYYLDKGIVKKRSIDLSRANFLKKEAQLSFEGLLERVELIGINKKNSNSIIKDCYDILSEVIRSKMNLLGYSASGQGAHESEISFSRKFIERENDVQFLNKLRYFRNGMIYYGSILDIEYAQKVFIFTKRIYLIITKGNK